MDAVEEFEALKRDYKDLVSESQSNFSEVSQAWVDRYLNKLSQSEFWNLAQPWRD